MQVGSTIDLHTVKSLRGFVQRCLRAANPAGARPLSAQERGLLAAYIPAVDLEGAVLHEGTIPLYLHRRYRAIARGNHIYLRPGAYDPRLPAGIALLGHELVHVGQYREGMTWLSYLWSARRGYSKSSYEQAAREIQTRILYDLSS